MTTIAKTTASWPRLLYWRLRARVVGEQAATRVRRVRREMANGDALAGKVAVITGAGTGIGRAITTTFARAGAVCIVVTLERDEGDVVVDELARAGYGARLFIADVADDEQVRAVARQIASEFPRVDILVNNAGVYLSEDRRTRASAVTDELLQRTLAVNLYGAVHMSRALADLIPSGGRIINVSSALGRMSFYVDGTSAAYRLSKAALNSYTRSLAAELQSRGIMVDCFHPGWVKTTLGGPGAKIDPEEATHTPFFLATRAVSPRTGLFWEDCGVMRW